MIIRLKLLELFIIFAITIVWNTAYGKDMRIRCASTTSTQNSGLFDYILPIFEKKTGIKVDVVGVGTGAAIEIGKRGDADLVFVHAKELELKAVEEGYFVNRHDVMYNDFVIVGPPHDPAEIKDTKKAVDAFSKIAKTRSLFVSRGDRSGTHTKELSIWEKIGINPNPHATSGTKEHENYPLPHPPPSRGGGEGEGGKSIFRARGERWYLEVGQGMEKALRIADEKRAYTLTDRGTLLATKDRDRLDMAIVLEGDPILFNQYGIMAVNPEKHPYVKFKEAMEFINWIISPEGQKAIMSFKDKHGNVLFYPNTK